MGNAPLKSASDSPAALRQLGERLFHEKQLSADGRISCASCHQPDRAFTDGLAKAVGLGGQVGSRNTPTLLNVSMATTLLWDGRRDRLETQVLDPLSNPREHGLPNAQAAVSILELDADYVSTFARVFGHDAKPISLERIGVALAAFQRGLNALDSPFDRLHFGGKADAMSPAAQRGMALFQGKAQCVACHPIGTNGTFSDGRFHSLSIGLGRLASRLAPLTQRVVSLRADGRPVDHVLVNDPELSPLGRFLVTLDPKDIGAFRTPSLRNVALTAPYMHDGSVATLEEAVELEVYDRGSAHGRPLVLSPLERADVVAFLRALTSPWAQTLK